MTDRQSCCNFNGSKFGKPPISFSFLKMLANTRVQLRRAINVIIDAILMSILHETTRKKD